MDQSNEPIVVGVRFSKVGKVYHFSANSVVDVKVGDMVVVETSRGWQLGQVAQVLDNPQPVSEGWKPIDRRATPRDLLLRQMWQMKEAEVVSACRSKAGDLRLVGIKIVSAEYSFDGSRLTILFSSETEEKYDLKSLRHDMQKMFAPSQVEMRQVGPRDVAKVVCGMGACGLETRCCCLFLTEFSSISIRMAKEQGISLTPTEITGMCGRLRCCLIYEYDTYVDARSKLPKRNKRVRTPQGEGKVVDVVPLRESVLVELPEVGVREFSGSEISLVEEGAQQQGVAPYVGSQSPSEIDQAIVGDAKKDPFVITPDDPARKPKPGTPPAPGGEQTNRPSRQGEFRGDRRRRTERPERRDRIPGDPQQGSGPQQGTGPKQGSSSLHGSGQQPGSRTQRPQRPKGSSGEQKPGQPGQQGKTQRDSNRGRHPKGGRDSQRRKGRQRDNNDEQS